MTEIEAKYCVYLHRRGDKIPDHPKRGEVFYVGIGNSRRPKVTKKRSVYWKNVYRKHGRTFEVLHTGLTWDEACAIEIDLIAHYGRSNYEVGGILANLSTGGGGVSGLPCVTGRKCIATSVSDGSEVTFKSASSAALWLQEQGHSSPSPKAISKNCYGKSGSAYGYFWRYVDEDADMAEQRERCQTRVRELLKGRELRKKEKENCLKNRLAYRGRRACIATPMQGGDELRFESVLGAAIWFRSQGRLTANDGIIGSCCRGGCKSVYGYFWRYENESDEEKSVRVFTQSGEKERLNLEALANALSRKSVIGCDLNGNERLFMSGLEAEVWLRDNGYPKASLSAILLSCKGKNKRAYGHYWRFVDEDDEMKAKREARQISKHGGAGKPSRLIKPIIAMRDGAADLEFESGIAAAAWLRENGFPAAGPGPISSCCTGRLKTAYGYVWRLKNETEAQRERREAYQKSAHGNLASAKRPVMTPSPETQVLESEFIRDRRPDDILA